MFPLASNLYRRVGFRRWCSLLWQSWHNASRLSKLSATAGSFMFLAVRYILWCAILAGSGAGQRSHKYCFDSRNASRVVSHARLL
jgi:hypothetical protein